jgi:hypothetical protein
MNMAGRVTLALAGAILAGTALSAQAADPTFFAPTRMTQATVDLYGGFSTFSFDDEKNPPSPFHIGGLGRANIPLQGMWNLQADVGFLATSVEGSSFSVGSAYLHFYNRTPTFAYGIFGGYTSFGSNLWQLGVEGQHYMGPWTFTGQAMVGLWGFDNNTGNILQLRGQATYDFTPFTSLSGDLAWTHLGGDFGGDGSITTLALTGMHRFAGSAFGIFAQGRVDFFNEEGSSFDGHSFTGLAGVRFYVDAPNGTNTSSRRTGPPWDVLPFVGFITGQS